MSQEQEVREFAPEIGEECEVPSQEVVLGGRVVTVYPMTMASLEILAKELAEPLSVVMNELLANPLLLGGVAEGDTGAMLRVVQPLYQKHIVGALMGVPGLLRRVVATLINLEPDHVLLRSASPSEIMAAWKVLVELNDFSAIVQQLGSLLGTLTKRYTGPALGRAGPELVEIADESETEAETED